MPEDLSCSDSLSEKLLSRFSPSRRDKRFSREGLMYSDLRLFVTNSLGQHVNLDSVLYDDI